MPKTNFVTQKKKNSIFFVFFFFNFVTKKNSKITEPKNKPRFENTLPHEQDENFFQNRHNVNKKKIIKKKKVKKKEIKNKNKSK